MRAKIEIDSELSACQNCAFLCSLSSVGPRHAWKVGGSRGGLHRTRRRSTYRARMNLRTGSIESGGIPMPFFRDFLKEHKVIPDPRFDEADEASLARFLLEAR